MHDTCVSLSSSVEYHKDPLILFSQHQIKHIRLQSELHRPVPWNQSSDVHSGSTLIMDADVTEIMSTQ